MINYIINGIAHNSLTDCVSLLNIRSLNIMSQFSFVVDDLILDFYWNTDTTKIKYVGIKKCR